ncbi:MAG: hypothetical protein U9Q07_03995 [Planctomycetota bacterium]|nr:hypothetical protein [Planctomycetota bacterium]
MKTQYCRKHEQYFGGVSGECLLCVKAERAALRKENSRLRVIRDAAAEVIDALCLPGHPIEKAWDTLVMQTGRYREPFLKAPDDFDTKKAREK